MDADLFEIKLNQQGREYLLTIKKWARYFYAGAIVSFLFDTIYVILIIKMYLDRPDRYPLEGRFYMIVNIFAIAIFGVLLAISGYFFYGFAKRSSASMEYRDETGFNDAFRLLKKHSVVAAILFMINSVWAGFLVYLQMKSTY